MVKSPRSIPGFFLSFGYPYISSFDESLSIGLTKQNEINGITHTLRKNPSRTRALKKSALFR